MRSINICNDIPCPSNLLWGCRQNLKRRKKERKMSMNREYNWKHLLTFAQFNFSEILAMAAVITVTTLAMNGFCVYGAHCFFSFLVFFVLFSYCCSLRLFCVHKWASKRRRMISNQMTQPTEVKWFRRKLVRALTLTHTFNTI